VIAAAPLDPESTALLMIASPRDAFSDPPGADPMARAAALLARARATGAHVVHVRHVPESGPHDGGESAAAAETTSAATVAPIGWESVLDSRLPDPFHGTGLAEELGARGVVAVVVAGPMSLACCDAASLEALSRRYRTIVADDATDAREQGTVERERLMRARTRAGVEVLSSAAIASLLDATTA